MSPLDSHCSTESAHSVTLNLSSAFHNKTNLSGNQAAFGSSFYPSQITLDELAAHIASGKAFTMHSFKSNRRVGSAWQSSQLIGLDLDDCPLSAAQIAELDEIKNNAWLVYPSPSSTPEKPKTRVLFVLPEAVTEPGRWQAIQLGLLNHFAELNPDKACKDLARLFYGSDRSGHIVLRNTTKWAWIAALCIPLAESDYQRSLIRQRENRVETLTGTRAERYAEKAFNTAIDELSAAGAGERNATLFKVSAHLYSMVLGQWPGITAETVRSAIQGIFENWPNSAKSLKTMESGFKAATAKKLELPTPAPKAEREQLPLPDAAKLPAFTADRHFNTRYVSDAPAGILDAPCIALKSPTGSGKSKWAAEAVRDAQSLLTVAFRTSLVKAQAADYGAMVYDALVGADSKLIGAAPRVSTTIDSLYKFENRVFQTIVIDEWVSLVGHFSSAGTLRAKAAHSWELLKRIISTAERVIVMDATLTDDSLTELLAIRGDVVCVENRYIKPKVTTQLLPSRLAFFTTAMNRLKAATLPVLLGVTSPTEARLLKDLITNWYPDKHCRVITVKQSHLNDTQAFIRDINRRLSEIDVLIFNGAMSTGVDIQADVDSIVCLIDRPLSPADGVQMLGRARNAPARFARVPDGFDSLDNDAAEMFQNLELAARLGRVETSKPVRSLARLHSRHEARRNNEISNYLPVFRAYCHADGSDTEALEVRFNAAIAAKIKSIREAHTMQKRADVLNTSAVPTITPEMLDSIRQAGIQEITPEIDAGYLRHKIETATAQPINADLFDQYHTKQARAALYRADISSSAAAAEIDQRENADDLPLHQRTNAAALRALRYEGLKMLGAKDFGDLPGIINGVTAESFSSFGSWAAQNVARFQSLLGYRAGHDTELTDDLKALRFFLKRFGITLDRKQVMRSGQRFYIYFVDAAQIAAQLAIVDKRRVAAEKARQESITSKRQNTVYKPFRSNSPARPAPAPKPPKIPAGASSMNPFSRAVAI